MARIKNLANLKVNANQILNYHLFFGHIKKPKKCDKCGLKKPIEAHHQNYSKPLKVRWLCRQCHIALHTILRKMAKARLVNNKS